MNVEQVATATVTRLLSRNPYLVPHINAIDSVPVWDGDVLVYRTKDSKKKNIDLLGRVPVQVKGKKVDFSELTTISSVKYRVRRDDMVKYLTDGGAIYIVIFMDDDEEKVYYNSLLPLDLERLLKKYENQGTFNIDFKPFPTEDTELADLFFDFVQNRKKQLGTLNPSILYIDDIKEFQNDIEKYKFGFSTVNSKFKNPLQELSKRTFYLYAEPKRLGNPIPFEKVSDAIISLQENFKVAVKDIVYYKAAYVQWEKGISKIICSKGVNFQLLEDDNVKNKYSVTININLTGTLEERRNDLKFIQSLSKNDEIVINNQEIQFQDFEFSEIDEVKILLSELEKMEERFRYFGYFEDVNLELLTPEEEKNLSFIMENKPLIKEYSVSETGLLYLKIAGINLLILVEKNEIEGYYILNNFFEKSWNAFLGDSGNKKNIPISQFLVLDKIGLLADNLQSDKVLEDIKAKHTNNMQLEIVNTFLLEAIKAYDEKAGNKEELKNLIFSLSRWLYEQFEEDYIYLNLAQVKYRLGILDNEDIEKLEDLEKNDLGLQTGVLILLEKYEEVRLVLEEMVDEERNQFRSYPIYNLFEEYLNNS